MSLVQLTIKENIGHLEINRPESLNALNSQVIQELRAQIQLARSNQSLRVLVLKSAGNKAFVAGADIKELSTLSPQEAQNLSQFTQVVFRELETLDCITIARLQGFTLGGGLELAMACDLLVASDNAKFGMPEVSLGLIPGFGGTQRLRRRIGFSKAVEWISTGNKFSASEALQAGLLNRVTTPENLDAEIEKLTTDILKNGPNAIKVAKKLIFKALDRSEATEIEMESAFFGLCFGSKESNEGMEAFMQKRPAKFNL